MADRELTQKQLEEMVNGKPTDPQATFFEKAALDHKASQLANCRKYRKAIYITKFQAGVTDRVSELATQADMKNYPEEYAYFQRTKQGQQKATINIIPGLDIIHMAELTDAGLATIEALAKTPHSSIPAHLWYAQEAAARIHKALNHQEASHGKEENRKQETQSQDHQGQPVERLPRGRDDNRSGEGRQIESRPEIPSGDPTEGVRPARRVDSGQGVDWGDSNWSISLT